MYRTPRASPSPTTGWGGSPNPPVNLTGPFFGAGGDGRVFADIGIVDNIIYKPAASGEPSILVRPNGYRLPGVEVVGNHVVAGEAGFTCRMQTAGVVARNTVCPGAYSNFLSVQLVDSTGIAEYGNACGASPAPVFCTADATNGDAMLRGYPC